MASTVRSRPVVRLEECGTPPTNNASVPMAITGADIPASWSNNVQVGNISTPPSPNASVFRVPSGTVSYASNVPTAQCGTSPVCLAAAHWARCRLKAPAFSSNSVREGNSGTRTRGPANAPP
jgi:hypothetical protein